MGDLAGEASVILKNMAWRALYNKLVLYFVILVLIAANIGVIYAYWGPSPKKGGGGGGGGGGDGGGDGPQ